MIYLTVGTRNMNKDNWPNCWGHITASYGGSQIEEGRYWAVDNGVFVGRFKPDEFTRYLETNKADEYCLFVVAPDVVCNAVATMDSFRHWSWRIKSLGWPVAFVAQDGQESFDLPPEYDCLFIGGSTNWKMSRHVRKIIVDAKKKDKWIHVGRVNTGKRIKYFKTLGVNSVDGTALAFGPKRNRRWIEKALLQESLFEHP